MHTTTRSAVAAIALVTLLASAAAAPVAGAQGAGEAVAPITLSGTVTDPSGAPVAGAEVQIGVVVGEEEPYWYGIERVDAVLTAADGSWAGAVIEGDGGWSGDPRAVTVVVLPPTDSGLARTFWGDCVASWRFGDDWPSDGFTWPLFLPFMGWECGPVPLLASGDDAVRDIQLRPGASVDVVVRGSGGAPLQGAEVTLGSSHVPDGELVAGPPSTRSTDASGTARFAGWGIGDAPVWTGAIGYRGEHLEHIPFSTWGPRYADWPGIHLEDGSHHQRVIWLDPMCATDDPRPFPDVDPRASYGWDPTIYGDDGQVVCGEVRWLRDVGLGTGYADGSFRPTAPVSRAAVVTWLWRRAGSPTPTPGAPTFTDVPPTSPFHDAIAWATTSGITSGYADGSFRPTTAATTQAVVVMAWRAAGEPGWPHPVPALWLFEGDVGGPAWDLPVGHPFRSALRWALSEGLVDPGVAGSPGTFAYPEYPETLSGGAVPGEPLPRGLAAGIVHDLHARLGAVAP